jgi:N-acetyl-gamma-glutamyl-phosphate reductase
MSHYKAGIIGGAGYTAGELIRILYLHPNIDLAFVQSESNAGKPVSDIHDDLLGSVDIAFTEEPDFNIDVLFLCKGHGEAAAYLKNAKISSATKIIDLSQDFRISDSHSGLQESYGEFVYGLCELNHEKIRNAKNIANPGCFATSIQLGLLPLASNGLIDSDIHISAITGSTGAGQQASETSHFSWRNNNISVYKPFKHQHLEEIYQTLRTLQEGFPYSINFIPYRGNFTRGILATMYLKSKLTTFEARDIFNTYYRDSIFVKISGKNVHLKQVVNTNNCFIYLEKFEDNLMIVSVIDNLLKGASGQSVQNMNIMFGLKENTGLDLKASAF